MDEGKFVADFIASNIDKAISVSKKLYGSIDESIQIKLKTAYHDYLTNTKEKYSRSKSFFIRNQSVDLYSYYVPTGVYCGNNVVKIPKFNSLIKNSKRIVITGVGGSGKSVLMRHLFLDCIASKKFVPILIELRDLNNLSLTLDQFVKETLDTFGFDVSGDYVKKAQQEGHFCFFLDGYDEVDHSIRKKLIKQIIKLSNKYIECPIFISSRPDEVFNGIEDYSIFGVLPLDFKTAIELVEKLPFDKEIKIKFIEALESGLFTRHESFLSNPLLLSIMLLTYGENAEIPSKLSIFCNQAYEALFQRHDANKGGYVRNRKTDLDIQDFSKVFSLFALQTYEKRMFKMTRLECLNFIDKSRESLKLNFNSEDYLSDLLSAACLLTEDGLKVAFSHRSFQEYFVALHISVSSPAVQEKLINRYWRNMTSDNVMSLLYEVNQELVERVLLLPRLEKMFKELGVRDKVGVTHASKHFKKIYEKINGDSENCSASKSYVEGDESNILHMSVELCGKYEFPSDAYFDKQSKSLLKKYGKEEGSYVFETKDLTFKSPIMQDILKGEGVFSISYLQAGFDAYKGLRIKYEKQESELDELLGIL